MAHRKPTNKMLSLLGTRYLMVLSADSRRAIEKVTLTRESGREATKGFSPVAVTPNGITIFGEPAVSFPGSGSFTE